MIVCRPSGDYTLADAEQWALNPDCIVQEKADGWWCRITFDGAYCSGVSLSGLNLRLPPCGPIAMTAEIDGELCGSEFVAFDVVSYGGKSLMACPLRDRLALLATLPMPTWARLVRQWDNIADALEFIRETDGEGIVLKHLASPYDPARCGWTRAKRQITEDFHLLSVDTFKQSAEVGEVVNGRMVSRGRIFGLNQSEAEAAAQSIGSVVEVCAMQRTRSGKLRHGRFKRFRPDKAAISGHFLNGQRLSS